MSRKGQGKQALPFLHPFVTHGVLAAERMRGLQLVGMGYKLVWIGGIRMVGWVLHHSRMRRMVCGGLLAVMLLGAVLGMRRQAEASVIAVGAGAVVALMMAACGLVITAKTAVDGIVGAVESYVDASEDRKNLKTFLAAAAVKGAGDTIAITKDVFGTFKNFLADTFGWGQEKVLNSLVIPATQAEIDYKGAYYARRIEYTTGEYARSEIYYTDFQLEDFTGSENICKFDVLACYDGKVYYHELGSDKSMLQLSTYRCQLVGIHYYYDRYGDLVKTTQSWEDVKTYDQCLNYFTGKLIQGLLVFNDLQAANHYLSTGLIDYNYLVAGESSSVIPVTAISENQNLDLELVSEEIKLNDLSSILSALSGVTTKQDLDTALADTVGATQIVAPTVAPTVVPTVAPTQVPARPELWTQPVLTSMTSYGTVTSNTSMTSKEAYLAFDGSFEGTATSWEGDRGQMPIWLTWELPVTLSVKGMRIYNKYTGTGNSTKTLSIYSDAAREQLVKRVTLPQESFGYTDIVFDQVFETDVLSWVCEDGYLDTGQYLGIGEIFIDADVVPISADDPQTVGLLQRIANAIEGFFDGVAARWESLMQKLADIGQTIISLPGTIVQGIKDFFTVDFDAVSLQLAPLSAALEEKFSAVTGVAALYKGLTAGELSDVPPVITMGCPAFLIPYYGSDTIVLLDMRPYQDQFAFARSLINALLWFGFGLAAIDVIKVRLHIG